MNYLGKRKRSDFSADDVDVNTIQAKSLKITDEYAFPETKGNVGDILVQGSDGDLLFEAVSIPGPDHDDLNVENLSVGITDHAYSFPTARGAQNQVLAQGSDGSLEFTNILPPSESKGDLLFFSTQGRTFSYSDGVTLRNLSNTSGYLGSLTLPARSMKVGDVFTMRICGKWSPPTGTPVAYFRVQVRSDAHVLADTNDDFVHLNEYSGSELDPTVPFEIIVQFIVRHDPTVVVANNVHTIAHLRYSDLPVQDGTANFMDIFPASPLGWDNTTDIVLSVHGLVASHGNAEFRVESYTLEKQFIGFENVGEYSDQSLRTTDDVQFNTLQTNQIALDDAWTLANNSGTFALAGGANNLLQISQDGTNVWKSGANEAMRLTNAGRLGLGTNAPGGILTIRDDTYSNNQVSIVSFNDAAIGSGNPIFDFSRSRGTDTASAAVTKGDGLGAFRFRSSYNTSASSWATGAQVACEASTNWNSDSRGTNMIFKVTPDGSKIPTRRLVMEGGGDTYITNGDGAISLTVRNDGAIIVGDTSDGLTEYIMPVSRGTDGQLLQLALTIEEDIPQPVATMTWVSPFKHYNYQTMTESTVVYHSATPSIIRTGGGTETKLDIDVAGDYTMTFSAEASLLGNLPQQLTARVSSVVTELESLAFTNHVSADWGAGQVLTAGNYSHTGAMGLSGTLTLLGSATDTFVFHTIGALTTSAPSSVVLVGGVVAMNVFWIVDGAFSTGVSSVFKGVVLGKAATTLGSLSSLEGRLYGQQAAGASAMACVTGGNIDLPTLDNSPLITLGVLAPYMMYNSWGPITRTGVAQTNHMAVLTGLGTISGFGAPYDATYDSGIVQPLIWVDLMIYLDGVGVPMSMRCIRAPVSDCHCFSFSCDITCTDESTVDARLRVKIADTACIFKTRCLNMTLIHT
jgi:hypothetical protein